jgi:hypothetical protein
MRALPGVAALLACTWSLAGSAQAAPHPCPAVEIVGSWAPAEPMSKLEVLMAAAAAWDTAPEALDEAKRAGWPTLRDRALTELGECTGLADAPADEKAVFGRQLRAMWKSAGWEQTKIGATRAIRPSDPMLAPVLDPTGGVPAPQRLQLGLSQVISGGQPGMMASAMGALAPTSRSSLWSHLSVASSVLVLQAPAAPDAMMGSDALPEPTFGAIDVAFLYSSKPTIYDWTNALTRESQLAAEEDQFAIDAWNITDQLLETLSAGLRAPAVDRASLLKEVVVGAGQSYFDSTGATLEAVVGDTLARLTRPVHKDWAVRLRVSPDATYVPELPDLMSLAFAWSGEAGQERKLEDTYWRLSWSVDGDLSAFPTAQYTTIDWGAFTDSFGGVVNASIGGVACFPVANQASPTRLEAAAVARWSKHRNDDEDSGLYSGGGHISLVVPVAAGISLVGTYTFRYEEGSRWITTTSFTFAKSVSES